MLVLACAVCKSRDETVKIWSCKPRDATRGRVSVSMVARVGVGWGKGGKRTGDVK